jgi:hypothetical protein
MDTRTAYADGQELRPSVDQQLANCRAELGAVAHQVDRFTARLVEAERGEKIARIAAEALLRRVEDVEAHNRDLYAALGLRWGDNPFPRIRALTSVDREAVLAVARDIGTVIDVASRPSEVDENTRQMIRRLTEWRARLLAEPRGQAGAMLAGDQAREAVRR